MSTNRVIESILYNRSKHPIFAVIWEAKTPELCQTERRSESEMEVN